MREREIKREGVGCAVRRGQRCLEGGVDGDGEEAKEIEREREREKEWDVR